MDGPAAGRRRPDGCWAARTAPGPDVPRAALSCPLRLAEGRQSVTMQRTRIKFCGMTRTEDALAAARLGVDAIGFVLTRKSRRSVGIEHARQMRRALPPFVVAVALFMDDD